MIRPVRTVSRALAEPERRGLEQWLVDTAGETAAVVVRLATAGRAATSCRSAWSARSSPNRARARSRWSR